jgi:hypothetical protein
MFDPLLRSRGKIVIIVIPFTVHSPRVQAFDGIPKQSHIGGERIAN